MKQVKEDQLIAEAYIKVLEDTHSHPNINTEHESEVVQGYGTPQPKKDAHLILKKHEADKQDAKGVGESLIELDLSKLPFTVDKFIELAKKAGLNAKHKNNFPSKRLNKDSDPYYFQITLSGPRTELVNFVDNMHKNHGHENGGFQQIT